MSWTSCVRCKNCDARGEVGGHGASFLNKFHIHKFCERCGSRDGWYDVVERWIYTSIWWNPKTWSDGYWERKQ